MFLTWNDLNKKEKEQAENSFLSIMEDIAFNSGDEWDKNYYKTLKTDKKFKIEILKEKNFIRDKDGYIFVSI